MCGCVEVRDERRGWWSPLANQSAETHPRGDLQSCLTSRLLDVEALWGEEMFCRVVWTVVRRAEGWKYDRRGFMFVCGGCGEDEVERARGRGRWN
jgi:hypothetical protein